MYERHRLSDRQRERQREISCFCGHGKTLSTFTKVCGKRIERKKERPIAIRVVRVLFSQPVHINTFWPLALKHMAPRRWGFLFGHVILTLKGERGETARRRKRRRVRKTAGNGRERRRKNGRREREKERM